MSVTGRRRAGAGQRFLFVGGKGGVGKTTCAAAYALARSAAGRRVLLVSTDPAHSLADALGLPLGAAARTVAGSGGRGGRLMAAELDAEGALARWLGRRQPALRLLARRVSVLDDQDVARLSELPLPGVDELAGLLELRRLAQRTGAEEVVVDTAPTGHTLRLLAAPAQLRALSEALDQLLAEEREVRARLGAGQEDAADRLVDELAEQAVAQAELLQDPARCACLWVTLPEELALAETRDGVSALRSAGIAVRELIVNRSPRSPRPPRARSAAAGARRQTPNDRALAEVGPLAGIEAAFPDLPLCHLPELAEEPLGVPALRAFGRLLVPATRTGRRRSPPAPVVGAAPGARRGRRAIGRLVRDLAPPGRRLLFFAGKGGVGKTTCAAAAALGIAASDARTERARRPQPAARRLLLVSVDPAHSLGDVLRVPLGDRARSLPPYAGRLRARELDPAAAWRRWRQRLATVAAREGSSAIDDLLQLTPPGIDELLAVLEVSALLRRRRSAQAELVLIDCAPTGHALRLLRMPEVALGWTRALLEILLKYRRVSALGPLAAELLRLARALRELAELLRDPAATAVCVVTRAGRLPGRETERLVAELARRRIRVGAVLGVGAPPASASAAAAGSTARACAIIFCPWRWPPPRGVRELGRWVAAWEETSWSAAHP